MLNQVSDLIAADAKSVAGLTIILMKPQYDPEPDLYCLKIVLKSGAHFKCDLLPREQILEILDDTRKIFTDLVKISETVYAEPRSIAGFNVVAQDRGHYALKIVMKSGAHFLCDAVSFEEAQKHAVKTFMMVNRAIPE
jgi:hypothetical protein